VLRKVDARATVEGPVAFTELRLTFHNPEPRQREGQFALTLPPGAAISRFAMKIHDNWMEGEVVEKQKAHVVYEDFLHRKQDPAILEQDAGNTFRARVFPIFPNADKELLVSWSHAITSPNAPYVLPLAGLPALETLRIRALIPADPGLEGTPAGMLQRFDVERTNFQPGEDFEIFPDARATPYDALRSGDLSLARVGLQSGEEQEGFDRLVVLFDTSASEAPGFDGRLTHLKDLASLSAKHGCKEVVVIAFDQTVADLWRGAPDRIEDAVMMLRPRGALGASNLGAALDAVAPALGRSPGGVPRVVLLSNGVATAGAHEVDALQAKARALGQAGVVRLDAVTHSTARDDAIVGSLVTSGLPHDGVAVHMDDSGASLDRLVRATLPAFDVAVPGAVWAWPRRVRGLQAGDSFLVHAQLPPDKDLEVALSNGIESTFTPAFRPAARPLVERSAVGAKIALLTEASSEGDEKTRDSRNKEVLDLSIRHRVLSPVTALLVLETEQDYKRYNIQRTALADILTLTPEGMAVMQPRKAEPPAIAKADPVAEAAAERAAKEDGKPRERAEDRKMTSKAAEAPAPPPPAPPPPAPAAPPAQAAAAAPAAPTDAPKAAATDEANKRVRHSVDSEPVLGSLRPEAAGRLEKAMGGGGDAGEVAERSGRAEKGEKIADKGGPAGRGFGGSGAGGGGAPLGGLGAAPRTKRPMSQAQRDASELRRLEQEERRDEARQRRLDRLEELREQREQRLEDLRWKAEERRAAAQERVAELRERKQVLADMERNLRTVPAVTGRLRELREMASRGNKGGALAAARAWVRSDATDVMGYVALGEQLAAAGNKVEAARAYGSILDIYPSRTDLRRFAGNLLEQLDAEAEALAVDTYAVAQAQRPDHPSVYHMHAMALARLGRYTEAMDVLDKGLRAKVRPYVFHEFDKILREDLQLVAAAAVALDPTSVPAVTERLARLGLALPRGATIRFILTWETDANDVDFHILDKDGGHAFFARRSLFSGGELFADVTKGYGPECFRIDSPKAFPYRLLANYYSRGPMGYGMGRVQVIRHDGKGKLGFEEHPFVVMEDRSWVELATVTSKARAR